MDSKSDDRIETLSCLQVSQRLICTCKNAPYSELHKEPLCPPLFHSCFSAILQIQHELHKPLKLSLPPSFYASEPKWGKHVFPVSQDIRLTITNWVWLHQLWSTLGQLPTHLIKKANNWKEKCYSGVFTKFSWPQTWLGLPMLVNDPYLLISSSLLYISWNG